MYTVPLWLAESRHARDRIARHLDAPAPVIPPKEDLRGRYQFMSDAVLKAVAAVTRLLESDDPAVVMKAAKMILDLDKTRMRHGQQVHGLYKPDYQDVLQVLGPVPGDVPRDQPPSQAELAAEFERIKNEINQEDFDDADEFESEEDFDDVPAVRPIPYVMGVAPTPAPPPLPAAQPPNPEDDDDPALTGEEEYRRWVTGYYSRDRSPDPVKSATPAAVGATG